MSYGDMICFAIMIGIIGASFLGTVLYFALAWLEKWGFVARDGADSANEKSGF